MTSARDEASLLRTALDHAALRYRLEQTDDGVVHAVFDAASPELPEGAQFMTDAPPGWFRIATVVSPPTQTSRSGSGSPEPQVLANYNMMGVHLGFGQVHWDARVPGMRICVHAPAPREPPLGSFVRAAVEQCLRIRAGIERGIGDPAFLPPTDVGEQPSLQDAVLALGEHIAFRWHVDGTFAAEVADAHGIPFTLRALDLRPGVFAFQALLGMSRHPSESVLQWLHALNAGRLSGGALVYLGDQTEGTIAWMWTCPYVWLDPDALRGDTLLATARVAAELVRHAGG